MNELIIKEIANNLNIKMSQVEIVLKLLEEGNTIPFIARYRKEATNALDEEIIRQISDVYNYQVNLFKRKEDVIRLIEEKGLLTEELKNDILKASKLIEVEDIYRPYKEKKKTKATDAIANGLESLAKYILKFPTLGTLEMKASEYLNDNVKTIEDAIAGAGYIIAEIISDDAVCRKEIRRMFYQEGIIVTKLKKNAIDLNKTYEMYYDYNEKVNAIKPHRILAVNRGENDKILNVSIEVSEKIILDYLERKTIKNKDSFVYKNMCLFIKDSLKRLIYPSIEREIRSELSERGENSAIDNFGKNVESLLLTPPIKDKVVMGFDPAFRTGCKLAIVNNVGDVLSIDVIYPTEPHNKVEESKKTMLNLIDKYNIDIVAIGNGTASRESEKFVVDVIKDARKKVEYIIVNEAGASVYSASKLAIEEFPDLTVEKRSAVSIARRLQDSLSELVKIDPKSIGVGLYQHDVTPKKLDESLEFVVTKTVNRVGVNINTASQALLKYVSGLNKTVINKIIEYRSNKGKIKSREELKKIKGISDKVYEQSIGFLRIMDGENVLDKTPIHPDNYKDVKKLFEILALSSEDIGTDLLNDKLKNIDINEISKQTNIDKYTLLDIIESLQKPNRDPRDNMSKPLLKSDILQLEDLKIGDKLQGTVRNVIDFGAFIDVGLHNDGLAHISKLSNRYIKHPSDVVSVGDIVDCYVIDINKEKEKLSLSLIEFKN